MKLKNTIRAISLSGIGLLVAASAALVLSNQIVLKQSQKYLLSANEFASMSSGTQAIIVLGAYVRPNGIISPALRERLDKGLELYKLGVAAKILVSGDHGTKEYDEVQAMKDYLLKNGVPESDVFMDHAGFDTYDSMYRARAVFGVRKAVVVSQDFHVPRAVYIGRNLGLEVYGVASDIPYPWWMRVVMREWLARVKAVWDVEIAHPQPKFLGPQIDISGDGRVTQD